MRQPYGRERPPQGWHAATDHLQRWYRRCGGPGAISQIVLAGLVYLVAVTIITFLVVSTYLDHATLAKHSAASSAAKGNFNPTASSRTHVTEAR